MKFKIGMFNLNYGVAISTKISRRSSIRLGIAVNRLGYSIENADQTGTSLEGGFLKYSQGYDNLDLNYQSIFSAPNVFAPESSLDFEQQINYIEIPLDYIYHLKDDSKIHVDLTTGFGMLVLYDQSITAIDKNNRRLDIGEASNLKTISFNITLGSRLSYPMTKKLNLNVEPRFKYYTKMYSDAEDFVPFSIGVRFGATYQF